MMELGLLAALLLLAEVLGTIGGFGSSMLVMPVAGLFLPFDEALGLTAVFHVFSNGAKMFLFRSGLSWRLVLSIGIPAVIGVVIGARLTALLDADWLLFALGCVLVAVSSLLMVFPSLVLRPTAGNALSGGATSGFIAGLVGTGGAIRGLTLAAFGLEKTTFIATSAWIDMGVDLSRTVVYYLQGYVNERVWLYLPALALISWSGTWIGRRLLTYIDQERFRKVVLGLVLLVGLYLVIYEISKGGMA